MSPDPYPANSHMMMSPDVFPPNGYLPRLANEQHSGNNYLPSVSYSLDHLDRLDYQVIYCILFWMYVCVCSNSFYRLLLYTRIVINVDLFIFWPLFLFQGPEMLPYQPNSESCLIGCYNTDEIPRQVAIFSDLHSYFSISPQHLCALFSAHQSFHFCTIFCVMLPQCNTTVRWKTYTHHKGL